MADFTKDELDTIAEAVGFFYIENPQQSRKSGQTDESLLALHKKALRLASRPGRVAVDLSHCGQDFPAHGFAPLVPDYKQIHPISPRSMPAKQLGKTYTVGKAYRIDAIGRPYDGARVTLETLLPGDVMQGSVRMMRDGLPVYFTVALDEIIEADF